jgi:hypothetical protein
MDTCAGACGILFRRRAQGDGECCPCFRGSEIAEALRYAIDDATAQEGGRTDRTIVAELMLEAFDAPAAGADARSRLPR